MSGQRPRPICVLCGKPGCSREWLFCEVEGGEDWPETAGLVQSVHSEGPNRANGRAL